MMKSHSILSAAPESAGISLSSKATLTGGIASVIGGLGSDWNWPSIIGSAVAILGFISNLYFQRRRLRLEKDRATKLDDAEEARREQLHQARLAEINKQKDINKQNRRRAINKKREVKHA